MKANYAPNTLTRRGSATPALDFREVAAVLAAARRRHDRHPLGPLVHRRTVAPDTACFATSLSTCASRFPHSRKITISSLLYTVFAMFLSLQVQQISECLHVLLL